jgi:soluble lytic murein transglycosylase-like protein
MDVDPMIASASFFQRSTMLDSSNAAGVGDGGTDGSAAGMPYVSSNASASAADPLAALELQFATFMKQLSKELSALEKRFTQALGKLAKQSGSSAAGTTGGTTGGTSASLQPVARRPVPQCYRNLVSDAARRHELDPNLLSAVICQESGFHADAVSKAGAVGLMQLMPDTARSLGVANPFDPQQNVEGGSLLLRQLLDRYHGRVDLALAAYNAGSGAVDKYGGVPPFAETQAYVKNILSSYRSAALTPSSA